MHEVNTISWRKKYKGIKFHENLQYFISIFGNGLKMNTTGIIILSAKKNVLQRNMKDHNDSAVFKFFN